MNRREFSLAAASAACASTLATPVLAQTAPREGTEYVRLSKPVAVTAGAGKVEVLEFFWYSCGHCNNFEPSFAAWKAAVPADVVVQRVPVAFNASFIPQQKLYYTLLGMGKIDELHTKVFHAIHVERNRLAKDEDIFAWIGKQGVDVNKFKEVYGSFTVAGQVGRAKQLQDAYGVEGVPSIGIAGRYYTDGPRAGSMANVLRVTDHLVAVSRKG